jgi:hypothetical protein
MCYAAGGLTPAVLHTRLVNTAANGENKPTTETSSPAPPPDDGHAVARVRSAAPVLAKHGTWTAVPLTASTWTQSGNELNLIAGTMDVTVPKSCAGGFGNALTLSVDDKAVTFATAPSPAPGASGPSTVTMPFAVGTLSEPGKDAKHTLTAKFGSSCTQDGEDFTIDNVKVDVLKFH